MKNSSIFHSLVSLLFFSFFLCIFFGFCVLSMKICLGTIFFHHWRLKLFKWERVFEFYMEKQNEQNKKEKFSSHFSSMRKFYFSGVFSILYEQNNIIYFPFFSSLTYSTFLLICCSIQHNLFVSLIFWWIFQSLS